MAISHPHQHPQSPPEDGHSSLLADISNVMVQLYKDRFGRGPTQVRTKWCGDDVLVVLLEGTLTQAERNMVKLGEHQRLRDMRMFFQYASMRDFCAPVEELTGRKVRSFVSGIDSELEGLSTELFVLHPAGYEGPSRIDAEA